ncbi:unnamed protein product [Prorocentrum cordatum]|uniref:Protein of centriole 5 n=1 Tax=Prorocentrum cordatum TaxID=2364126 RepID=A0ABN9TXN2_9DINO|nr:unnamed protein product [Polarella glacialis]
MKGKSLVSSRIDRIEIVNAKLLDYKTRSMEGVRKMLAAKAADMTSTLMKETFTIWAGWEVMEWKRDKELQSQMEMLNDKLSNTKAMQKRKSRAVLARMNADSEGGLAHMMFSAWVVFHQEYQKDDKAMEDEIKKKEQAIAEFLKSKSDSARKVLMASMGGTDSALLQMAMQGWTEALAEAKEEQRMADALEAKQKRFTTFGSNAKLNGMNALQKSTYYAEQAVILRVWTNWRIHVRSEATLRQYSLKIDAKRRQLVGVQEMFRSFANELESGLKRGAESTRGENAPAVLAGRGLHKSESTGALPDIGSGRGGPGRRPRGHEKEAMSRTQGHSRQHRADGSDRDRREHVRLSAGPVADAGLVAPRAAWS